MQFIIFGEYIRDLIFFLIGKYKILYDTENIINTYSKMYLQKSLG